MSAGLVEGKVAVVTGGSSAIGRAIAVRLAEEGARAIVVADLQETPREGGEPTATLLRERGAEAVFVQSDVSKLDQMTAAIEAAEGLGGLDILVNNAGLLRAGRFVDFGEDDYDAVMTVNVKSAFFMSQAAARSMKAAQRRGVILNLSSIGALKGLPGIAAYCAAKGAVRSLTYALAHELGPSGIRVCALHPGVIDTSMTRVDVQAIGDDGKAGREIPLGRNGLPSDVAEAACFLASDRASFISGASLVMDGGQLAIG